jgi:hypothetical protein
MSKLFCARQPKYSPSYFRGPLNYPCFSLPLPWIEDHKLLFHGRPQVAKFEFWDFCTFSRWEHSDESICLSPHLTRVSLASSGRWGRWSKPRLVIFLFRVYKCYLTHCKFMCAFLQNMLVTFCNDPECQQQMLQIYLAPPWIFSWCEHFSRCAATNENLLHRYIFCCTSVFEFLWFLAHFQHIARDILQPCCISSKKYWAWVYKW